MKWPSSKKSDAWNGITRHVYVGIAKLARSALNLVQSRYDRPKVIVRNERHSNGISAVSTARFIIYPTQIATSAPRRKPELVGDQLALEDRDGSRRLAPLAL